MFARMQQLSWMCQWGQFMLTLIILTAGCRSNSGCGKCCGERMPASSAAVVAREDHAHASVDLPPSQAVADKAYGGQKTCPIMDEPLGSMGPAIPVVVKGQTVYVCCKSCATKVQRDPDQYLAKVKAERGGD